MISLGLARRLRDAGLRWDPTSGDRFVVADREMDEEIFTVADMTIEVHGRPGAQVLGFNGSVEWALDSVDFAQALWLPSETQLRERLAATFRRLEPAGDGWRVVTGAAGRTRTQPHADAAEAYGLALLDLVEG